MTHTIWNIFMIWCAHLLVFIINLLYHSAKDGLAKHLVTCTPSVPFSAKLPIHQSNSVCLSAPDILLQLDAFTDQLFSNNDLLLRRRDTSKPVNLLNSINSLGVHEGVLGARNHTFEISLNPILSNWQNISYAFAKFFKLNMKQILYSDKVLTFSF